MSLESGNVRIDAKMKLEVSGPRLDFKESVLLPLLNLFLFFAFLFRKLLTEDLELVEREFNIVLDL